MRVPVEVRGTAADGMPLEESTHTGVIGALGAMIWLSRMMQIGTEVEVTNHHSLYFWCPKEDSNLHSLARTSS